MNFRRRSFAVRAALEAVPEVEGLAGCVSRPLIRSVSART